jgi:spore coat protein U-like protein
MRKSKLLLALASIVFAGTAFAGSSPQTAQFNVTASVQGSCQITSNPDLAFGVYDPAQANAITPKDASSTIGVRCVKGMTADVALDQGMHAAAGSCAAPARRMQDGSELLRYDIYQDAGHASVWGCDATNDRSFTAAASNADTVLTTYGRIPAGQNVGLGTNFSDTVTINVTF